MSEHHQSEYPENTTYSIVVSDAALAMLDSHVSFLAKVSVNAAKRYGNDYS